MVKQAVQAKYCKPAVISFLLRNNQKTATTNKPFVKVIQKSVRKGEKVLRRPGIEPGSTAWKAAMLTTIPPTRLMLYHHHY